MNISFGENKKNLVITFGIKRDIPDKGYVPYYLINSSNDTFNRRVPDTDLIKIPIKNDEEFYSIFRKVLHEFSNNGQLVWITLNDWQNYKKVNMIDLGLVPYVGFGPGYKIINMYLKNDLTPTNCQQYHEFLPMNENSIVDVIRTLEYSLQKLDKTYGKHKGIVYRQGYMDENPNMYISTSLNPIIAANIFHLRRTFSPQGTFAVIRTINGHKINEFQRKAGIDFSEKEEEILLSYNSKFKKLKENEIDTEIIEAKKKYAESLYNALQCSPHSAEIKKEYTKERFFNLIDVYQEI